MTLMTRALILVQLKTGPQGAHKGKGAKTCKNLTSPKSSCPILTTLSMHDPWD